jgi:tetratricopeptide (TPR) repeat protein
MSRFPRFQLVGGAALALVFVSGCGALTKIVEAVAGGPEASITRLEPAAEDLPSVTTIALGSIEGKSEDTANIAGVLGEALSRSQRFDVAERDRLDVLAKENGCSPQEVSCVAKVLPASAIVLGRVTQAAYRENVDSSSYDCKRNGKDAKCVTRTRKGTARVAADLRLVETASGKVLLQRRIMKTEQTETRAEDDQPEAIDSGALLELARAGVARDFFAALSPHEVYEQVPLEHDGDLPDLDRGNDLMKQQDLAGAVAAYQRAAKAVEASPSLDKNVKAKAYYCLAVGLAGQERYDEALAELGKAQKLAPNEDWAKLAERMTTWRADAAAVSRQLAFRQRAVPASPPPEEPPANAAMTPEP